MGSGPTPMDILTVMMSKSRLLVLVPRIPFPTSDGGANYVYHTLSALAQAGHAITTATFTSAFHPQDAQGMLAIGEHVTTDGTYRPYSLTDAIRSLLTGQAITVQARMKPALIDHILPQLKGTRFDAILIEGIHAAVYIPQLRDAFPDAAVIIRQSNVEFEMLSRNAAAAGNPAIRWFYQRQASFMKRFETEAMRMADGVTAISESDADTFRRLIPGLRCAVVAPGCHIPASITPASARAASLVAISNWSWAPNHVGLEWFIRHVWPKVSDRAPECRLDVVGGGLPDHLSAILRADPRIRLHGFVPDTEPFRQSGAVFIAPLLSGGGVKIKVVEAMASGIPIVTNRFGAEGLPVANGVHLHVADDPERQATLITELLSDPAQRQRMADDALDLLRDGFSWENRAKTLTDFISELRA